nr:BamA/TamA family outer membrane protein [uncultured Chitinophaga sp.]
MINKSFIPHLPRRSAGIKRTLSLLTGLCWAGIVCGQRTATPPAAATTAAGQVRPSLLQSAKVPPGAVASEFDSTGGTAWLLYRKSFMDWDLVKYNTATWKKLRKKRLTAVAPRMSLNANDSLIAFSLLGKIKILDAQNLKTTQVLWERTPQKLVVFDPATPTVFASVTSKVIIQLRDLRNDSILTQIIKHDAPIQALSYSPDGKYLFSLDKRGKLCVWSPADKTQVAEAERVENVYWDNEGALYIVGGDSIPQPVALKAMQTGRPAFYPYKVPTREIFPAPIIGYAPEAGFILGAGITIISQPSGSGPYYRPSLFTASAAHGFNGSQWLLGFSLSRYLGEHWYATADLQYNIDAKNYYFGIGKNADKDNKLTYTSTNFFFNGGIYALLGKQLGLGLVFDVRHNKGIRLEHDEAPLPIPAESGLTAGIGAGLRLDSRDNIFLPSRGAFLQLAYLRYGLADVGDFPHHQVKGDLRKYFPLGSRQSGRVLAVQGAADLIFDGQVPFYMLPYFTADKAFRGIYRNLYLDNQVAFLQAEYRSNFSAADPRYGYVIFAGAADGATDFFNGYKADIKAVYGLGFRQQLYPKHQLSLRLDAAWTSKGDFGIFAGLGTSF